MKTYEKLQKENDELIELLRKVTKQLARSLELVAESHEKKSAPSKGEWHHRKFAEHKCPNPTKTL